jgi:hypothetical protein
MGAELAARVKAANQFERKWKAARDAGLSHDEAMGEDGASAGAGGVGSPVVVVETEVERMRRERREKKDRFNVTEKISQLQVDIDPDLEARVAYVPLSHRCFAPPCLPPPIHFNHERPQSINQSSLPLLACACFLPRRRAGLIWVLRCVLCCCAAVMGVGGWVVGIDGSGAAHRAVENHDDPSPMPETAALLKDNERCGVLEERVSALIGYNWVPHTCLIKDGHFYWIKDEKVIRRAPCSHYFLCCCLFFCLFLCHFFPSPLRGASCAGGLRCDRPRPLCV